MYKVLLVILLFLSFACHAVELTETTFEQVKNDIKALYSGTAPTQLKLLQWQEIEGNGYLRTSDDRQGELWVHLPLKQDAIRLLQIPHAFFDLHTKQIGESWFALPAYNNNRPDILMLNTEHRYETKNSDMSRIQYSLFTAVVAAFIELDKSVSVVQLHGFNPTIRKSDSGTASDFILSNGTEIPSPGFLTMQSCLRDNMGILARTYGRDVFELGATINPVGKLIRSKTEHQVSFLHIEMSTSIRQAFVADELPEEVISCLLN